MKIFVALLRASILLPFSLLCQELVPGLPLLVLQDWGLGGPDLLL
jgi:hypothetical protein